jgi:hypothetical protein
MKTIRQRLDALERDLNTEPLILTMPDGRIVTIPNGAVSRTSPPGGRQ